MPDIYTQVESMIKMYEQNPDIYTEKEIQQLQQLSQEVGIPFEPQSSFKRKLGIFAGKAADTALLGMIPNEALLQPLTKGEQYAGMGGELAGTVTPGGLPSILGRKAATMTARGVGRLNQLANRSISVPATATELGAKGGFSKIGGIGDLGKWAGIKSRRGIHFTAEQMKKFGLEKQAQSFRSFMMKQSTKLDDLQKVDFTQGKLGKVTGFMGKVADSGTLQNAAIRGVGFGTQLAAANLGENIGEGNYDQIISDFMGGASVGAIGGFLTGKAFNAGRGKVFNLRNLAKAVVAYSAGQGIPAEEDQIYARLLTLAGLTIGAKSAKIGYGGI